MVNQAAAAVSRSYSPWTTYADTAASLWLWVTENDSRVTEYLGREDGERILYSILRAEARTHAIKERSVKTGYSVDDLEWYSPRMIRNILPDVFDYNNWTGGSGSGGDGRGSKPLANATGDRLASILDVKSGYEKLLVSQQLVLKLFFDEGNSLEAIAFILGITEEAARKRLDRAVYALGDKLNNPRAGDPYEAVNGQFDSRSSGRRAQSNASARARTDSNWDGQ
jgi:DNA-directed RNA polymerase specialized sigma24 family protein